MIRPCFLAKILNSDFMGIMTMYHSKKQAADRKYVLFLILTYLCSFYDVKFNNFQFSNKFNKSSQFSLVFRTETNIACMDKIYFLHYVFLFQITFMT